MKIYLLILLFVLILLFAITIYFYYKERVVIYKDLKYICGLLSRNIKFKKSSIDDIMNLAFPKVSFVTKYILKNNNYLNMVLGKENSEVVKKFFESLGQGDVGYELSNIEYFTSEFGTFEASAKEDLQKKGMVYFKLIIGFGLMAFIILL